MVQAISSGSGFHGVPCRERKVTMKSATMILTLATLFAASTVARPSLAM